MRRLAVCSLTVLLSLFLFNSNAFAVDYYGNSTNTDNSGDTMTPDEFSSEVNSMSKDTQQRIVSQGKELYKPSPAANMPSQTNSSSSSAPTDNTSTNSMSTSTPTPTPPIQPSYPTTPPAATANPPTQNNPSAQPYMPPTIATPPQQSQTYTGFGAQKNTNTGTGTSTTNPSSGNSGGWNIKY